MGERNARVEEGFRYIGEIVMKMVAAVDEGGAILMGAEMKDGINLFATKHPGIIETVKRLGMPQELNEEGLPKIEGAIMLRTYNDFERACLIEIWNEQDKPNSNTPLIALLADAVRLVREATSRSRIIL
jgi:hypothetical protein